MHTLNQIMAQAPAKDDTSGATTADVMAGKKFWGLTGGQWGLQTGNLATQTLDNTTVNQAAGYYNAFNLSTVDTDLASGNIRSTVSIYGVAGDPNVVDTSSGDAAAGDVLQGKKAWVDGAEVTGSMPNNGAVTIVPTTTNQTIALGYHDGSGKVEGDADLVAGNIAQGVNIFGVAGSAIAATGDATAGDVLTGKTFSNAGAAGIAGTMPDKEGDNASTAQAQSGGVNYFTAPQGYYDGDDRVSATDAQVAALDADITAGNIKSGVSIFGVTGTYPFSGVPKTGQTDCHKSASPWGACTCGGTNCPLGQDGDLEKGVAWPNPRFTANVDNNGDGDCTDGGETCNGTVTDNLTGLIWLKDANCYGTQTWANALSSANTLNSGECGLTDGSVEGNWRLPNVRELQSLVHYGVYDPAVPNTAGTAKWTSGDPFTGVQSDNYWSSTTCASNSSYAWRGNLQFGSVNGYDKTLTYYVWPVRGGQ
jgi:hypothetical protein